MTQVKHFKWVDGNAGGRVAIKVDGDRITIKQIAGDAPPWTGTASIAWWNAINQAFRFGEGDGVGLMVHANTLNEGRVNRWAILDPATMSGCSRLALIIEKDVDLLDFPIVARMHISMYGKLNEGVNNMWIGDFRLFMEHIQGFVDDDALITITIDEVPTRTGIAWNDPPVPFVSPLSGMTADQIEELLKDI